MKRTIIILSVLTACLWLQSCSRPGKASYEEIHISASNEAADFLSAVNDVLSRTSFMEENFESKVRKDLLSRNKKMNNELLAFVPKSEYEGILLYIHGGAWVFGADNVHTCSCEKLAEETGFKVVVPDYPLAPEYTYDKAFEYLEKIYLDLLKEGKRLVVGGDSAGGNIALAFVECLKEKHMPLPEKIILISPCVDMNLSNPDIAALEATDPVLAVYGLKECAKMWRGSADAQDYHFRPLYGNLEGMPDVLLFAGDREIFYPDCKLLANALKGKTSLKFVVGHGLWHIFPMYYFLPEGEQCRKIIADFIESD